jgi:hypothetical protein
MVFMELKEGYEGVEFIVIKWSKNLVTDLWKCKKNL